MGRGDAGSGQVDSGWWQSARGGGAAAGPQTRVGASPAGRCAHTGKVGSIWIHTVPPHPGSQAGAGGGLRERRARAPIGTLPGRGPSRAAQGVLASCPTPASQRWEGASRDSRMPPTPWGGQGRAPGGGTWEGRGRAGAGGVHSGWSPGGGCPRGTPTPPGRPLAPGHNPSLSGNV